MSTKKPSSSTYVKPLEQERDPITVLAVGVPEAGVTTLDSTLEAVDATATITRAATADEAIEQADRGVADCIVVGDALEGASGVELYDRLPPEGPPLVIYTGEGNETVAATAINAGVAGYVPYETPGDNTDRLAERIETVVDECRSKKELIHANRLLLRLTEYTNDTLWMFSGDWADTAIINESYDTVWNRNIEDLIADSGDFLLAVHPDDRHIVESAMGTLSNGEPAQLEYRIQYDDADHWLSVHAEPVIGESGAVEYVAGFTRDITDLKERELGMRTLNEASTALLEAREKRAVAEITLDTIEAVIEPSLGVVRTHDHEAETLDPLAATSAALDRAEVADATDLDPISSTDPLYDAYKSGSPTILDADELSESVYQEADIGSVLLLPLGDHSSLEIGLAPGEQLQDFDRDLVELLGRTATAAVDRVERDQTLEAYREQLEKSNENLQQFAYIASHDLQEPLRMVSSYVDLLESEYGDQLDEEAEEYMEFAVDGATRMKEMIDGLLSYSRVTTQGSSFDAVDPEATLAKTERELSLFLDEQGLTVEYESLPTIRADGPQLGQVFQNLIKNAAIHGDASTVEITATTSDDEVEFTVSDDGVGIPERQQEKIFDIFEQGEVATGGSGIGLAVCERIVYRHDGDIWVEPGDGDGTELKFIIPRSKGGGKR